MPEQYWSWILSFVGVSGFLLAGRKVWWAWYINIFCQVLWFAYAFITEQWGFIVGGVFYGAVFSLNAYKWTKEHFYGPEINYNEVAVALSPDDVAVHRATKKMLARLNEPRAANYKMGHDAFIDGARKAKESRDDL